MGGFPVALLLMAYNTYAFGSPLSTGYRGEASAGWTTPLWIGLPGMLLSPSHGLLMYSPVLLLAAYGGWSVWRTPYASTRPSEASYSLLGKYLAVACLAHLILMSHWWAWHGGNAYNQRMLQEIHPLLIWLLGYALGRSRMARPFIGLLVGASAWSVSMNIVRITFYDPHWSEVFRSELVWSWRDAEVPMYVREHGLAGFMSGSLLTTLWVLAIIAGPTLLFYRLMRAQSKNVQVYSGHSEL
jgi:hypothetical protein